MFDNLYLSQNRFKAWSAISFFGLCICTASADGTYRNGVGARSMALGGADAGYAIDPLGAMAANPAGMGFLSATELDVSGNVISAYGDFNKGSANSSGHLNETPGVYPDIAIATRISDSPLTVGFSFTTESGLDSDWHYNDPVGTPPPNSAFFGAGTSYGYQHDKSVIIVLRTALGAAYEISPEWSVGANFGMIYNNNQLESPYIFQHTPGLIGGKVLLDLHTDGFGWNALTGVMYKPTTNLQFGLSYKSETTIFTSGTADGNGYAQMGGNFPFHYDADVKNVLPQMASGGASWKFADQWRLALQVDWINWADAFQQLPVVFKNGSNGGLPGMLNDTIPLNWKNEFVYRAGIEYAFNENLTLRGGYCYGESPVPGSTLSPLTATIPEHTLTAGIGYRWSRYSIEAAYQADLPVTRHVGASELQAGEYSNSSVEVGIHTLAITAGIRF